MDTMCRIAFIASLMLSACVAQWDTGTVITPVWDGQGTNLTTDPSYWDQAVLHAAEEWTRQLGKDCEFPFVIGEGGLPITLVQAKDWNHGDYNGYEMANGIDIADDDGGGPFHRRGILMHEFGHAFGLHHVDSITSIMHPYVGYDTLPTTRDIRNARLSLGCSGEAPADTLPPIIWMPTTEGNRQADNTDTEPEVLRNP